MDFKSTTRTIRDMLSLKRRYIIPRFQREYSWSDEELKDLWNDLLDNLAISKEGDIVSQEYFLGSIVLVGDEDSSDIERQVVDGQQRLMTITIMFSVLAQKFKERNEGALSKKVHEFIIGEDENGDPITKLKTETPKPFFQYRIQERNIDFSQQPGTAEERAILNAYKFFDTVLTENRLRKELLKDNRFTSVNGSYIDLLKLIRDQVLGCKVIYVTVKSFDDAYQIFEVLNAKGKDLEPTDIIKNTLFSILDSIEPIDMAYEKWKEIRNNISTGNGEDIKSFYRHFWLSKYSFVTKNRLVTEFNRKIPRDQESYTNFLNDLVKSSQIYKKIIKPLETDWVGIEKKQIYKALRNINLFGIKQSRTMILALLDAMERNVISNSVLVNTLDYLEYFHFVFNAICSTRSSDLERINSSFAREISACQSKVQCHKCLKEYKTKLADKLPPYDEYEDKFFKLYFTQDEDSDKKIVQYILRKYEEYCNPNSEVEVVQFTIEHILSESAGEKCVGYIGNMLILGEKINSSVGDGDIISKMRAYKKSSYKSVEKFVKDYKDIKTWNEDDITKRTKYIARCMYERKIIS